jgi:hypothetical protein
VAIHDFKGNVVITLEQFENIPIGTKFRIYDKYEQNYWTHSYIKLNQFSSPKHGMNSIKFDVACESHSGFLSFDHSRYFVSDDLNLEILDG